MEFDAIRESLCETFKRMYDKLGYEFFNLPCFLRQFEGES